ncbi:MAG: restriction endonuclease subunit S, partial [Desulfobulbaceae bacterium]|nr:restriction endonuclease subunit S [Desulfobulbaceae bacterium]
MKPYPKYKDSGVEWLGVMPEEWKEIQLRRCLSGVSNGTTANQQDYTTDYPVARIETISSGKIDPTKVGYLNEDDVKEKFVLDKGDILFSHINSLECVGNCAIFDSENLLVSGMNLLRLQPNQKAVPAFLLYYTKNHFFKNLVQANSKHAINQVSVPSLTLKSLKILLPSKPEQTAIAEYLDRKTAEIDSLVAKKQRLIELYEEEKTAVINQAVTKGIDP